MESNRLNHKTINKIRRNYEDVKKFFMRREKGFLLKAEIIEEVRRGLFDYRGH